jgi:hypothetical protein
MLAGLRIDGHAANGIENLSIFRVGCAMTIVMMCVRAVSMRRRDLSAAAVRSA